MQNKLPRGTIIKGEYEVIKRLGNGAYTSVYMVRSIKANTVFALKLYGGPYESNSLFQRRFDRELEIVNKFSQPNLLKYYASGTYEGSPYIIMDYVRGENLQEVLAYHGRIPVKIALSLLCDALNGLAFLHKNGIVHRDFKPSAIFVDNNGIVKLADFDIAKKFSTDEQLTNKGLPVGSELYMAPEQRLGRPVDPRADIFAAGVTLYELITGKNPWQNNDFLPTDRRAWSKFIVPSKLISDADPKLDAIIAKAMDLQPANRYCDASEMLESLRNFRLASSDDVIQLVSGRRINETDISNSSQIQKQPIKGFLLFGSIFAVVILIVTITTLYLTEIFGLKNIPTQTSVATFALSETPAETLTPHIFTSTVDLLVINLITSETLTIPANTPLKILDPFHAACEVLADWNGTQVIIPAKAVFPDRATCP